MLRLIEAIEAEACAFEGQSMKLRSATAFAAQDFVDEMERMQMKILSIRCVQE